MNDANPTPRSGDATDLDYRVSFPVTADGGMVHMHLRPISAQEASRLTPGFLFNANDCDPASRKDFCDRLEYLEPTKRHYKLFFLPEKQGSWGGQGESYQLALLIVHLRHNRAVAMQNLGTVVATGLVDQDGGIGVLNGGRAGSLEEKLAAVLAMKTPPDFFVYPAGQNLNPQERAMLAQLPSALPIRHLRDLPESLVGAAPAPQSHEPEVPGEPDGLRFPWTRWWLPLLVVLLVALLLPMAWDLWTDPRQDGRPAGFGPAASKALSGPVLPRPAVTISFVSYADGAASGDVQLLQGGERLPTGRVKLAIEPRSAGYHYLFVSSRDGAAGAQTQLVELFSADQQERYLAAGQLREIPQHGFMLDDQPGDLEITLVSLAQPDPGLQQILRALRSRNPTLDPGTLADYRNALLLLPPESVRRWKFVQ